MISTITLKVLVVDDEKDFREALVYRLGKVIGHPPDAAESIAQALDKMNENIYDVLITDTNLNGESGIELIRTVKKLYPHIHIFSLFSGLNGSGIEKRDILALGVAGVMTKVEIKEQLIPELRALAVGKSLLHVLGSIFPKR